MNMPRLVLFVLSLFVFLPVIEADDLIDNYHSTAQPLLNKYCFECHRLDQQEGGLRIDELDPDVISGRDAETWNDLLDQINLGEMPPETSKQPSSEERRKLSTWIHSALRAAIEAKRYKYGRIITRRLTRYEYANSMRDLLRVNLDFDRDLPPEPASHEGFLNNGAILEMSPTQIESYLTIARRSLNEAIVSGPQPELHQFQQTVSAVGKLPGKKVAGHAPVNPEFILDVAKFPRHGEFELKVTAQASVPSDQGLPRMVLTMGHVPGIIHVPRGEIGVVDVTEEEQTFLFRGRMEDFPQPGPISFGSSGFKGLIIMIDFVDADGNELRYPDRKYATNPAPQKTKNKSGKEVATVIEKPQPVSFEARLDIRVSSVEFKAPVYASWPPPSHRRLLFDSEHSADENQYARIVLERFMTSAFRRPATNDEVNQMHKLYQVLRSRSDSFETAIREVFSAVLVSPHFLYIVEGREEHTGEPRLTDFELACRLSYFLWSSAPDAELFELAIHGELHQPEVLKAQTLRLLENERSNEFVTHFVNQWLDLDALNRVAVNPEFFPDFDDSLKQDMREQTEAYFTEVLHNNRSALDLLKSDWEMLNRPLAKHYGIDGPRTSQFERVVFDSTKRSGGLLTQGSYLLSNSNGEDSHPIKRAVWILDRLLDSPPAPPPPDVPELDPDRPDLANLTLKEQLSVHRQKESCQSCHQGIDPWGIPLEHFDAVGRWRNEVPAQRKRLAIQIDAASVLPNETEIDGLANLQQYLLTEKQDLFARSIVKRLMSYGLGRSLDYGDRDEINTLTNEFIENDFRIRTLIVDFVASETFQNK